MTYAALMLAFLGGACAHLALAKRWLGFEWRGDAALALALAAAGAAALLMVAL